MYRGWNLESSSQAQRLYSLLYKQAPNTAGLTRWQADAAAKGLVLEAHGTRARHAHASAPWEAILEFVGTALQLPKVAAEQPFALLIY